MIVCAKDKSGFNILKHKKGIILVQFYLLKIVNIHKYNDEHYEVYVQMRNWFHEESSNARIQP